MHAARHISELVPIFYNRVISHGHIPDDFIKTVVIPLVKINLEKTKCCHRIWILMTTSLDLRMDQSLYICLKNYIQYYRSNNSSVCSCIIDSSKAFHRVNHGTRLRQLLSRDVSVLLNRIMLYWCRTQTFRINRCPATFDFFSVSNLIQSNISTISTV